MRRSPSTSRRASTSLLVLATLLPSLGCSGPLGDLAERHAAQEPPPGSAETGDKVVLFSPLHRGAWSFGGVRQAFTDSGVFLEAGPLGFKKSLWIPTTAIGGCSRTQWARQAWDTNLWVEDTQVLVSFPDNDNRVVKWCTQRGIVVFDRATESRWLHEIEGPAAQ
jgi:hypothetical protein